MRHKSLPRAQKGKIVKTVVKKTFNISDDEIANAMKMAERARLKEGFKAIDKANKGVKSNLVPKKKMGGSTLPKAQLGRTIKKAVKAVTKDYNIPRSVGRTEKSYVNYYPKKEWHGAEGRKLGKEYRKEKIYGKAALGATLAAGATAGVMMNKKGSSKSEKSKLISKKK